MCFFFERALEGELFESLVTLGDLRPAPEPERFRILGPGKLSEREGGGPDLRVERDEAVEKRRESGEGGYVDAAVEEEVEEMLLLLLLFVMLPFLLRLVLVVVVAVVECRCRSGEEPTTPDERLELLAMIEI